MNKKDEFNAVAAALEHGERQYRAFADGKRLAQTLMSLAQSETDLRASADKARAEATAAIADRDAAKAEATMARDVAANERLQLKLLADNNAAEQQKRLDAIQAEIDTANTELATVTAQLADARKAIAKITGSV